MKRMSMYFVLVLLMLVVPFQSWGQISAGTIQPKRFEVMAGKSLTLVSTAIIKRASVVNSEVADVLVISSNQIYVTGKTPGTTSLSFWGVDDKVFAVANLEVTTDLSRLKDVIAQLLPEEKGIKISSVHNAIAITGTVSSASALSQIVDIAQPYSSGKVVNLAEVSGVQQVMVEVRVAEISHTNLKKLGINWTYLARNGGHFGLGMIGGLTSFSEITIPTTEIKQGISSAVNAVIGGIGHRGESVSFFIDALNEAGLVKVLASPTLTTLNGKTANFLAGGEIPIPVPQVSGVGGGTTITVEYKPFGVGLSFTPLVLTSKKINFQVSPEVSEPDFSNSITLSGFVLPTFATRRVSTTIELDDGQSFVIAGLFRDDARKIISKYPLLGDIPILGALFRSTSWQRNESELVIVATPHLVKPADMKKQPLPTDKYKEPSDFDFYLKGKSQGKDPDYKPVW
jgi:pilus assembly protein CpaC